ncbi:hypothetical protein ACFL20_08580 [Spirochaetota bacterium]
MYNYDTDEWHKEYDKLIEDRKNSQPKPYTVLTPEWASMFSDMIKEDEKYKKVSKNWKGSLVLVFEKDESAGLDNDIFIYMDLIGTECRSIKFVPPDTGKKADYVLYSEYATWKKILKGELNVVKELSLRNIRLTPFNMIKAGKLAAKAQAAIRLVGLAGMSGDKFPDDLNKIELESYKALLSELNEVYGI